MRERSAVRRRRGLGAVPRRAGDADRRLTYQTRHHAIAIVLLDEHELTAAGIGTLNSENAGQIAGHGKPQF